MPLRESPLFGSVWSTQRWKSALPCQCFVIVSGRGKDAAWLELYIQQDTAYTKTCQNGTVGVEKWSARHHRILHGHSECQLLTKDLSVPYLCWRAGASGEGRRVTPVCNLVGPRPPLPHGHCRVWVRHSNLFGAHPVRGQHSSASLRLQDQRAAPLKRKRPVNQKCLKFRSKALPANSTRHVIYCVGAVTSF